jgi:hypothetical protein
VANHQLLKILEEALVVTLSTLMMMMTMKISLEVNPSSYSKDFSKHVPALSFFKAGLPGPEKPKRPNLAISSIKKA